MALLAGKTRRSITARSFSEKLLSKTSHHVMLCKQWKSFQAVGFFMLQLCICLGHALIRFRHKAQTSWFGLYQIPFFDLLQTQLDGPTTPVKYLDSITTNTDGKVPRCTFNMPGSVAENTATDGLTWPWKIFGFGCCKQTWKYPAVSLNTPASVLTTRPKMSPHLQNIQRCHACKCSNTDSNCLITRPVNNSQSLTFEITWLTSVEQ